MTAGPSSAGDGVAVVIPAFNASQFIEAALASVAAQTRPAEEVIVVDDASVDGTAVVAERWSDRLPVRVIRSEQNSGAGVARKIAIEATSQPYVANLDADDRWEPDHLETLMAFAAPNTIAAAQCVNKRADGNGGSSVEPSWIPEPDDQVDEILRSNFLFSGAVYPVAPLLDPAIGCSLLRRAEDWDTWIRLIVLGGLRAELAPRPTVLKVSHEGSVSVGRDYISADLDVYESIAADPRYRQWHSALPAFVRRRKARARLLDAASAAESGRSVRARKLFAEAAIMDRSFRGGRQRAASGSVAVRALVGVVSPRLFLRWRETRVSRNGLVAGGG